MKKYIGFLFILAIFVTDLGVVSASTFMPPPQNYKTIDITSPNKGETFNSGEILNVKWKTKNVSYRSRVVIDIVEYSLPTGSLISPLDKKYSINDGREKFLLGDSLPTGYYILRVGVVSNSKVYDLSDKPIFVRNLNDINSSPIITGGSGPQNLVVGETGTWGVSAYDPNGGNLSYSVDWGEHFNYLSSQTSALPKINQNTTFTHRYSRSGNYTVTFTVTNENGESETTSMTVFVNNGGWGNIATGY